MSSSPLPPPVPVRKRRAAEIPIRVGPPGPAAARRRIVPHPRDAGQPAMPADPYGDEAADAEEVAEETPPVRVTGICESPWHKRLRKQLGKPSEDRENCFGCSIGRKDSVAISMQRYGELSQMYQRQQLTTDPPALAKQMATFFEEKIRQPANAEARRSGLAPIIEWRAVDIYLHFREHLSEATQCVQSQLEQLRYLRNWIFKNAIFEMVEDVRHGGQLTPWPRPKMLEEFRRLVKLESEVCKGNPSRMIGYSPDSSIDYSQTRNWINMHRPWQLDDLPEFQSQQQSKSTSSNAAGGTVSRGRA